jgi:vacuolar-type H+-ATPase subunit I/STV1
MADDPNTLANEASFLALEGKIKRTYSLIQEAKDKLKEQREMFRDAFENDPVYKDQEEKFQEAKKICLETRQEILKDPAVASMQERIKEMRLSLKELQDALSEDLQQYRDLTGEKVIETDEGGLMEIISRARLVRHS